MGEDFSVTEVKIFNTSDCSGSPLEDITSLAQQSNPRPLGGVCSINMLESAPSKFECLEPGKLSFTEFGGSETCEGNVTAGGPLVNGGCNVLGGGLYVFIAYTGDCVVVPDKAAEEEEDFSVTEVKIFNTSDCSGSPLEDITSLAQQSNPRPLGGVCSI